MVNGDRLFLREIKRVGQKVIDSDGLLQSSDREAWRMVADVVVNWILLLVVIGNLPYVASIPLGFALVIRLFNCMAQLSHGCGHGNVFTSPRLNVWTGRLCSAAMGYGFDGHGGVHLDHHQYLNTPKDGDVSWGRPDQTRGELLRGLVTDLLGFQAAKRFLQYFKSKKKKSTAGAQASLPGSIFLIAGVQACVIAAFTGVGGPWAYFLFFALPICTLYPFQIRIRSLAEHHIVPGHDRFTTSWVVRNTEASFVETQIIGPFYQNYHLEHHLFPTVPGYFLKRLNAKIRTEIVFDSQIQNSGYLSFLAAFLMGKFDPPQARTASSSEPQAS